MATETLLPSGFTTNTWTSGAYTDCNNGVDTPTDGNLVLSTENEGAVLLIDFADVVTVNDSDTVSQVDVRYRGNYGANSNDGVDVELLISSSVVGVAQSPALTGTIDNYTLNDSVSAPNWNQDFTAAQLNSIQVRVTTTQGGMPSATDLDLSEIEVVITYTAAGPTINNVTITGANNYAATTDPSTKAERFRNTSLSDYIQKVSDAAWIPDVFSYAARVRNRVDLTALASTDDKTATYVPGGAGPTINNVTVQDLDSCAVTDFSATLRLRDRSQVNSFAVADNTVEIRLRDRSQVDSADVSDSSSQLRQRDRAQADTLDASDASLTLRARDRSQGDTLAVDDVNSQWIQSNNQTVETIDAADDSVESRERNRLLTDSVVVLDDKTATYVPPGSVTYSVTVQDLDSVAAADFTTELRFRDRSQIDSAVVVDDATATYVGSGAQIYSRTLQDLDSVEVADLDEPLRLRDREQTDGIDGRTNLSRYSEDLSQTPLSFRVVINTNVAIAPDGELTADRVNITNNAGSHTCGMNETVGDGLSTYTVSYHLKDDGSQWACIAPYSGSSVRAGTIYDLQAGTVTSEQAAGGATHIASGIESLDNGWYRCWMTYTLGVASGHDIYVQGSPGPTATIGNYGSISYTPGADGLDFFAWGYQLEQSDTLGPYVKTTTAAVTEYLRDDSIELRTRNREQADAVAGRTNLLTYSEQMDTAGSGGVWFGNLATVTANAGVSPTGETTAEDLKYTGTGYWRQLVTVKADTDHTYSQYFKKGATGGNAQWVYLLCNKATGGNFYRAWFDIANGVVGGTDTLGTGTLVGSTIEDAGDGWWRCSVSGSIEGGSTDSYVQCIVTTNNNDTTRDTTNSVLVWGAQLEESDTLGAYIPTTTAAVTEYIRDSITATYIEAGALINNVTIQDLNSVAVTDSLISIRERVRSHIESLDTFDDISASALRNRLNIETVDVSDSTLKDIAFSLIDALDTSDSSAEIRLRYRQLLDSFDVSDNVTVTIKRDLEINEVTTTDTLLVSDTVIAQKIVKIGTFKIYDGIDELPVELGVESLFVNHGVLQETS